MKERKSKRETEIGSEREHPHGSFQLTCLAKNAEYSPKREREFATRQGPRFAESGVRREEGFESFGNEPETWGSIFGLGEANANAATRENYKKKNKNINKI